MPLIRFCQVIIVFGILAKLYGVNDSWKRNDHYNFGGIVTTAYTECLKQTPLAISKGIPHFQCETANPVYYRAHPPTLLFGLWGWTSVIGSQEWAYRLFIFVFSTLNIGLLFLIARTVRPGLFPWLAAAMQSAFLGNMYFGTHLDFIGEATVFFVLMGALAALKGRITTAMIIGLLAGIVSWPGYIFFGPLWVYTLLIGRGRKRVFIGAIFGFCLALAMMMWLHQKLDVLEFLKMKLLNPGYIRPRERGWLEPLRFALNFVSAQARLLSPLFATMAFFELARGAGKVFFSDWRSRFRHLEPFHHAVLLSGGTGLLYAIIGHEYFMVHVYLYLLFTPALALLAARFSERALESKSLADAVTAIDPRALRWIFALAVLFGAVYPYGIYKTYPVHDALTSVALIAAALGLGILVRRQTSGARPVLVLVALGFGANLSQLVNYRNEPDTERSFCEKAREEYRRNGKAIETFESRSNAKIYLYCKDLPITYLTKKTPD